MEHLRAAVLTTERFTGRHITLPILSHILVSVKEKKITLSATNLEIGIECTIPGKVQKTGTITTPAKLLSQILHSLPNETVLLEANHQTLSLHTPSSNVTILGLNPNDFPTLPVIKKEYSFSIHTTLFLQALQQIFSSAATHDLKPELAGVFILSESETLTVAATDSFRLAEKSIPHDGKNSVAVECIIPGRTIQEVLRTLPPDEDVEIHIGEHQIVFRWGETRILSRLIDGPYPPYKNLFPKTYETSCVVNRDDFLKKIRLASVFSSRLNDVTLKFSPHELEITTTNTEAGGTASRIATKVNGKSGSVVFNYRYLLDGVEAIPHENVMLHSNGSAGPSLLRDPADTSFSYLLMPIRSV